MLLILDYSEWAHTSVTTQSHHVRVYLSCFSKRCPLCLKISSQAQIGGPQVRLLHIGQDCRRTCGLPQECQSVILQAKVRTQNIWLVHRQRQCPSYAHVSPPGPNLPGCASKLLGWNSQLWRGLGRGGEENVALIQLWNTTCVFSKDRKEEHKQRR